MPEEAVQGQANFQQRVNDERFALDQKIMALGKFIGNDVHNGLPQAEQDRLSKQFDIMQKYSDVLTERIEAFE